tara:strand:+ start:1287 stop:2075 length:789 start_codon:yes stop_codon:yes gene_type:complete
MVNIVQVFNTLKSLANEDQSGFITPSSFSDFAPIAQMNIYNEIMDNSAEAKKIHRASLSSNRGTSEYNKSKTRQAHYFTQKTLITNADGRLTLPSDFSFISSMYVKDSSSRSSSEDVDGTIVNFKYDDPAVRERSTKPYSLTTSSDQIDYNGFFSGGDGIVIKRGINALLNSKQVQFNYYRTPGSIVKGSLTIAQPALGVTTLQGGIQRVESYESKHFDLPASQFSEVVAEMAKLIGIQLEENMIYQYGNMEDSQPEKKNFD